MDVIIFPFWEYCAVESAFMVTWCVIWQMSDYLGNDNRCSGLEVRAGRQGGGRRAAASGLD